MKWFDKTLCVTLLLWPKGEREKKISINSLNDGVMWKKIKEEQNDREK